MRTVMAFVLTPLSLALVAALVRVVALLVVPGGLTAGSFVEQALMVLIWSPIVAYPVALVVGVPLYAMIRRFWRVTWWSCVLGGTVAGFIGTGLVIAVEGGDFANALAVGLYAVPAALGAIFGLVFWFVAFWRRPSAPVIGNTASVELTT
jgi:hypothetical protein